MELPLGCQAAVGLGGQGVAVVVVLSPRMVYSMTEWPRMRRAALDDGFGVRVWRSPEVGEAEWQWAVHKAGWSDEDASGVVQVPAACADWLGRPNHFPFSVVVDAGGRVSWPIWGVMPDAAWRESLRWRRDTLTGVRGSP